MMKSNVPTGVKFLAVLSYISSVVILLLALLMFFGASVIVEVTPFLAPGLLIVAGVFLLLIAILEFFIARGLFRAQNWARIVFIVFSVLSILGSLIAIIGGQFGNIGSLLISGLIVWYLWFDKGVKAAFKRF